MSGTYKQPGTARDADTMSLRMCRTWLELLTAAEDDRLRVADTGVDMHDQPSGQPRPAGQTIRDGLASGWLILDGKRYRRTADGDTALAAIKARLDADAKVTVRSCR